MFKTVPAKIKAAGTEDGLQEGQFRALVSVFNNRDAMGDVVVPGAFTKTLQAWRESGDTIPVYWSHQMHDPDFNIGWVEDAQETPDGLEVLATLDLDPEASSSKARQVYRLLRKRRVTQFSFAYDVLDSAPVEKNGQSFTELRELKLYEVGPTPIGANTSTELLAVKHQQKTGRTLSAKNEAALADAVEAITAGVKAITTVLASVQDTVASPTEDEGKATHQEQASAAGPATTKEPHKATVKEPRRTTPASTLAAHLTFLELEGEV